MSITKTFNGRQYTEPDVAARILGGGANVAAALSFGNVCLIDTGSNATFGGGSGINGQLSSGKDAIYTFSDATSVKNFLGGGLFWDLASYLFSPSNNGGGINNLTIIKAATTEAATLTMTFSKGAITIKTKREGLSGNGVISSGATRKGYSARLVSGLIDSSKYMFEFFEGNFRGLDYESEPYDGILQANASQSVRRSPEFSGIQQAITWMNTDSQFTDWFKLTASSITSDGLFVSGDKTSNTLTALSGGTEVYNPADLDTTLSAISELDNTFFLCDKFEINGGGTENNKILTHILNEAEFEKYMIVGGGTYKSTFAAQSVAVAQTYNSSRVMLAHGGMYQPSVLGQGRLKAKPSIYSAASILGRICGLEPQTPATFKDIRMISPVHNMTKTERIQALNAGVLHFRDVAQRGWVINQSVNTLQANNSQLINPDGQSYEISLERIKAQLNREMKIAAKSKFIGLNAKSASPEVITAFARGYLNSKVATDNVDNLILDFKNVNTTINGDSFYLTYEFIPNSPVNNGFITGYALDVNLAG